jgi:hypothetical protein
VTGYHKSRTTLHAQVAHAQPDEVIPARLDDLRLDLDDYLARRFQRVPAYENFEYYRGRDLACPYRCPLDCADYPVDVLIEAINRPRVAKV